MSGATIVIEDAALQTYLRQMQNRLSNPSDVMAEIGEILVRSTQQRFATQSDPDGQPWAPNSPVTRARKRNPHILTENGYLGDGIHAQMDGSNAVLVGSNRKYAAVQQFGQKKGASGRTRRGAPIPWGDIPARPFLGISDDDRRDIEETLAAYLLPGS
jgi:phage virion morphogenesis protein